jgi:sugar phosphate isomerase/epimerase
MGHRRRHVWGHQRRRPVSNRPIRRRDFCKRLTVGAVAAVAPAALAAAKEGFALDYIVASSMYGCLPLAEILPEVPKTGADHIDIWPRGHANQREQMEEMGHEKFAELLSKHGVKLGMLTHYDLGPFRLQPEMKVAQKFGASILISGAHGPRKLKGDALRKAVGEFAEKMKPHVAAAEEHGVTIGIENHGNSLIQSPDSMRWLAELAPSKHIGVALAPYHLPQDPKLIADLIQALGGRLVHFYAWQHGKGCHKKMPREDEHQQMPGRGSLDFVPLMAALRRIDYKGWTSVFMHPTPRGIPIMDTAAEVTAEIIRAQEYLKQCQRRI